MSNKKADILLTREKIKNFELLGEAVKTWLLSMGIVLSLIANAISLFSKVNHPHIRRGMARSVEAVGGAFSGVESNILNYFGFENAGALSITAILVILLIFWKKKAVKK